MPSARWGKELLRAKSVVSVTEALESMASEAALTERQARYNMAQRLGLNAIPACNSKENMVCT